MTIHIVHKQTKQGRESKAHCIVGHGIKTERGQKRTKGNNNYYMYMYTTIHVCTCIHAHNLLYIHTCIIIMCISRSLRGIGTPGTRY